VSEKHERPDHADETVFDAIESRLAETAGSDVDELVAYYLRELLGSAVTAGGQA
jgi:hypothetical protein